MSGYFGLFTGSQFFSVFVKQKDMPQEHVKINETLDVLEECVRIRHYKSDSLSYSESLIFIKIHPGSIQTRYWCAFRRRKLRADVTAAFPTLGTDQVSELVPGKEELNIVKLYAHRGDAVIVYVSGGNPILFELEKNLYPTGMAVGWRWPLL